MRKHRTFQPTAIEALEDRVVLSHLPGTSPTAIVSAALGKGNLPTAKAHKVDLNRVVTQLNQAYASFSTGVQSDIAATDFTPIVSTFSYYDPFGNPFYSYTSTSQNPSINNLRPLFLQQVSSLDQQVSTILATIPQGTTGLLPQVQSQILSLNGNSLVSGLNTEINTVGAGGSFSSSTPTTQSFVTQTMNLIAATRLATITDASLFVATTKPATHADPAPIAQLSAFAPQAFANFQNDFQNAFYSFGISAFDTSSVPSTPPSVLANFKAALLPSLNLLAVELSNIVAAVPRAERQPLLRSLQDQLVGSDPGSLLQTIDSTLDTIATAPGSAEPTGYLPTSSAAITNITALIATIEYNVLADVTVAQTASVLGRAPHVHGGHAG